MPTTAPMPPMSEPPVNRLAGWRRYAILGGGTVLIIGGVMIWTQLQNEPPIQTGTTNTTTTNGSGLSNQGNLRRFPANIESDRDGDGLTDEEESQAQTNPTIADSDQDGLSDAEEVKVWKTNPLIPDTDGDGHVDGEEVANGFDPNGPGVLRDVSSAIQQLNVNNNQ